MAQKIESDRQAYYVYRTGLVRVKVLGVILRGRLGGGTERRIVIEVTATKHPVYRQGMVLEIHPMRVVPRANLARGRDGRHFTVGYWDWDSRVPVMEWNRPEVPTAADFAARAAKGRV